MNMLLSRFRRRAHLAEELIDEAFHDHDDTMEACAAEESVGECLQMNELLRHAWATIYDQLFDGKIQDIEGCHAAIIDSVDRTINTTTRVQQMAKRIVKKGFEVKRHGEIDKVIPELKELRLEIERVWLKICPPDFLVDGAAS